ncbi:MAG: dTDP-4-dehydrorhamnose 3,5-epimerase [Bauldia sp.]|nr:dTDP-4-dehydrorhamnose 3,5-epimerase [Bauldia sp.]
MALDARGKSPEGREPRVVSFTVEPLAIPDVKLVRGTRREDSRGWFAETYHRARFAELGIEAAFVQENQSFSVAAGTLRGLHFQIPPHAQAKLVRVLAGAIFDVAVDLRRGSPTYGKWAGARLTAASGDQLFVPRGFAHGFCTEAPGTEVSYKCDAFYAAGSEGGLLFSDPALAIPWPVGEDRPAIVLDRDRAWPTLADFRSPFD